MRKTVLWTALGFGLALGCGLAGLAHLSATLITLTVFCAVPAFIVLGLDALDRRMRP
ncbi:UNVERIFIED_ORG: putative membrane protein YhiD involved in acid resistance [Shinella zoogloeoides]|nr:putative membrane protein YhiD involved in acid resistance [Shinella zoogloeoides]